MLLGVRVYTEFRSLGSKVGAKHPDVTSVVVVVVHVFVVVVFVFFFFFSICLVIVMNAFIVLARGESPSKARGISCMCVLSVWLSILLSMGAWSRVVIFPIDPTVVNRSLHMNLVAQMNIFKSAHFIQKKRFYLFWLLIVLTNAAHTHEGVDDGVLV